ncbi:GEVED domain-containing protein [Flavobacterium sp.]|uniref:GEVED domain-containing protein n=1 Tax=Flavobacterium sp. TaxID=239 RepID=UPI0026196386|nr:GEVED domain-containing protein [Flavobacterium sp.]
MKNSTYLSGFRWRNALKLHFKLSCLLLMALLAGHQASAQGAQTTVLINPNAEGGFENGSTFAANGWTAVNASLNTWNVGTVPGWFTGTGGAYVSNDSGTTWAYGNGTANRSHFYRDVTFPTGVSVVNLKFDWRGNGNDGSYDNLQVYIVDTNVTPTTSGPTGTNTTTTGWTNYTDGTTGYYLLSQNGTVAPTTTTNITFNLTAAQRAYVDGKTKRLVFVWKNDGSGGTNPPASVDNISLTATVPTCLKASNVLISAITTTSATLNWTASASTPSGGYEYEIRTSGAAGSGATGLANSGATAAGVTTAAVTGLATSTNFSVYVRANCGGGDMSDWTTAATFRTGHCVPSSTSSATYINSFVTTGGATNISNTASGYTTGGYQDNYATATVSQYATGSIGFTTTITGGTVGTAIWVDWNNDLVFDTTERVYVTTAYGNGQTGSFVVPAGTVLGDYRMRVRIDYNNITPDPCSNTSTRTEAEDYKLTVIAAPSCVPPTAVSAVANTTTTATVNWTASTSTPGSGYDIYYVTTNTAPTAGSTPTATAAAGAVTASLSGLAPSTTYYVWVRSNCGSGTYSTWAAAGSFYTGYCVPSSTSSATYINSFVTTGGATNISNTASGYTTGGYQDNYATAAVSHYPTGTINFATTVTGGTVGTAIWVDWNNNLVFETSERVYATTAYGDGQTGSFVVPAGTALGDYRMRVRIDYNSSTPDACSNANTRTEAEDYKLTVIAVPSCLPPSAVTAVANTAATATVNWTASTSAPANGYDIYYVTTNTAPTAGSTPTATAAAGAVTASLSGLAPSTTYYVWVRSNCGTGNTSTWVAGGTFYTGYCVPSSTSSATYINSFTTTGGSTNISNTASGYTTGGYQDNYATATVAQYPTGTINFATTVTGGTVGTAIWVDWNNNLVFETSERVYATTAYGDGQTGSFVVPAGTALGDYRMRVRIDYNNSTPDACASANTRTEAEDYKLTVVAMPSCMPPTAVAATANTAFTATVTWTASVSTPANGYEIYYSENNTAPGAGATPNATAAAGAVTAPLAGLTPSTTYYVWVRSNCGSGNTSAWTTTAVTFTTPCNPPVISATTPASICGQGTATLSATANEGNISWYAAQTGGAALGTGASFTTPVITATTSYWVESSRVNGIVAVGPVSPTAQGGTIGVQTTAWENNFTVLKSTKLTSVDIFPVTSGQTGAIIVRSSTGTVIATYPYTTNVGGGATAQTITLNHVLQPGNYQLYPTLPTAGVSRNTTGAVYPYTSSVARINGNGYDPVYFMGMYNWKFEDSCTSARTEVIATVTTPPALTLSTASTAVVCSGSSSAAVTVTAGASSYDTYTWTPATGVTGDVTNGWTFNPTATTTYTVRASNSVSGCNIDATVVVNINPAPVVNVAATPSTICEGTSAALVATTTTSAPGTITLGTGTTLTSETAQPTAFCNRWAQYWNQTVFTAAELTAAGLKPGNITSIAYRITTLGSGTNVNNFTVRIGTTTNSVLTGFTTTGLNLVYGPATYTHSVGLNTITFATPYVWDGVSNIIVDIRQDGADSTNNAITYYTATTDNTTVSATTSTVSSTTVLATSNPTPSLSKNRLNVVFGGQVASTGAGDLNWTWMPGNLTGSSVTVTPATTTTYTVRGTNPTTGCYTESTVTVNVNPVPAAPTGNTTQAISGNTPADVTIEDIVVTGTAVVWYATEADALANINPIAAGTQLVQGATYYAMQTVGGCRSTTPLAVTVTLTLRSASFDMAGLKYYPNPVIDVFTVTYTNDITSVEVFNLIGQRVIAVQPNATTALVDMSALPTGAYIMQIKANGQSQSVKVIKK